MTLGALMLIWTAGCSVEARPEGAAGVEDESMEGALVDSNAARRGARGPVVDSVLAVAQAVFDGINTGDGALILDAFLEDGRVGAIRRPGAPVSASTPETMAAQIAAATSRYTERMFDPVVEINGSLASVWAPYDFYIDGELSHCGVDLFQMVRGDTGWKIRDLTYTVLQPPACELHPEGPPTD